MALGAVAMLVLACSNAGAGGQPDVSGGPSLAPAGGFYLRAWQTQALAPQYTFGWMPVATIANGTYIDGQVVVPAIYPGPIWTPPFARSISQKGIDAVVAELRKQGLLGERSDFVDSALAGGITGHIDLSVDGKTYSLTGQPDLLTRCRCLPEPGTPSAFAAFWQKLTDLDGWLAADLGSSTAYDPSRVAVLTTPPAEDKTRDLQAGLIAPQATWPLAPFAEFGTPMGSETMRCAVVSGADLDKLLPLVRAGNQLTRFTDTAGVQRSLQVRVLVPGESSPCA